MTSGLRGQELRTRLATKEGQGVSFLSPSYLQNELDTDLVLLKKRTTGMRRSLLLSCFQLILINAPQGSGSQDVLWVSMECPSLSCFSILVLFVCLFFGKRK